MDNNEFIEKFIEQAINMVSEMTQEREDIALDTKMMGKLVGLVPILDRAIKKIGTTSSIDNEVYKEKMKKVIECVDVMKPLLKEIIGE